YQPVPAKLTDDRPGLVRHNGLELRLVNASGLDSPETGAGVSTVQIAHYDNLMRERDGIRLAQFFVIVEEIVRRISTAAFGLDVHAPLLDLCRGAYADHMRDQDRIGLSGFRRHIECVLRDDRCKPQSLV